MLPYPFPYFQAFTWGTPTIPNIYWDAYSYEERIKKLCMEYGKLDAYLNEIADTINGQYKQVEEINTTLPELVVKTVTTDPEIKEVIQNAIDEYISGVIKGTTYGQLKENGFLHS